MWKFVDTQERRKNRGVVALRSPWYVGYFFSTEVWLVLCWRETDSGSNILWLMKNRAELVGGTTYCAGRTLKVGSKLRNDELRLCCSPATVRVIRWGPGGGFTWMGKSEMWVQILTLRYCLLVHNSAMFNFTVLTRFISFYSGLCCEGIVAHFMWGQMTLTAWTRFKMHTGRLVQGFARNIWRTDLDVG